MENNLKEKIIAGIVTYNPKLNELSDTIKSIISQVDKTVVYDNASNNYEEVRKLCSDYNIECILSNTNDGVAKAYNSLFGNAMTKGYSWMITLDQDSIVPKNMVDIARIYMKKRKIGIIVPTIIEKNIGENLGIKRYDPVKGAKETKDYVFLNKIINSGAIVRVDTFVKAGGYDESLFLDYVDFDFSMRARRSGFSIIMMKNVAMNHSLGNTSYVRLLGRKIRYSSHSKYREYCIARNIVIYMKRWYKYHSVKRDFLSLMKHYMFVMLFDKEKMRKLGALLKGTYEGLRYKDFYDKESVS